MKQLLKVGSELTTDALGMVDKAINFVETEDFPGLYRRLLGESQSNEYNWQRRLAQVANAMPQNLRPDATVEKQNRPGTYGSINDALQSLRNIPPKRNGPYVVYVKRGDYYEYVHITTAKSNAYWGWSEGNQDHGKQEPKWSILFQNKCECNSW